MTTTKPAVLDSVDDLDPFAQPVSVQVEAQKLKSGMLVLDPDLGTPWAYVDHRVRGGHGDVTFYVHDLEERTYRKTSWRATTLLDVMAA